LLDFAKHRGNLITKWADEHEDFLIFGIRPTHSAYSKSLFGAGLPDGSGGWVRRAFTSSGATSSPEFPNEL
jgi:hypothetical protein